MKCQILFSGKNKKNNIILSSAENAQRVVKVNSVEWDVILKTKPNSTQKGNLQTVQIQIRCLILQEFL